MKITFMEEDGSAYILKVIDRDIEKYYLFSVSEEHLKQIESIFE